MFSLSVSFVLFFAVMCFVCFNTLSKLPQSSKSAIVYLLGAILFFGGILNFLIFWHVSVYIGGNAVSGKVDNGKYFVSSHGDLTEVTASTWQYSYAHTVSTWITHPLAFVGWFLLYLTSPNRKTLKPSSASAES